MSACPACDGALRGWRFVAAGEPGGAPVTLLRCVACGTGVTAAPSQKGVPACQRASNSRGCSDERGPLPSIGGGGTCAATSPANATSTTM